MSSESMRKKNPKRAALLDEARELGIVGRHKMSTDVLRNRVAQARPVPAETRWAPELRAGMDAIREVRRSAKPDDFEFGSVIRWTTDAGYNVFLYAALKTPAGWVTTARAGNSFVPQTISFEELLEILGRSETTDVRVASSWVSIS
jgi:hypothetical protein